MFVNFSITNLTCIQQMYLYKLFSSRCFWMRLLLQWSKQKYTEQFTNNKCFLTYWFKGQTGQSEEEKKEQKFTRTNNILGKRYNVVFKFRNMCWKVNWIASLLVLADLPYFMITWFYGGVPSVFQLYLPSENLSNC